MKGRGSDRIAAALARNVRGGSDAAHVAAVVAAALTGIAAALGPVLGKGGVAALFRRSLHLAGREHPWLESGDESAGTVDVAALQAVMERRSPASAAAGGSDLLRTFDDLLVSLIGAALTERLLRGVWADFPADDGARP